jgi:hypothetical protein
MDRLFKIEQPQERTAKPAGEAKKVGPPPWEVKPYKLQELQKLEEELRVQPSNSMLDSVQQRIYSHNSIPSGDDYGSGLPVLGSSFTPYFNASAATAGELGTLAGFGRAPVVDATCTCAAHERKRAKIDKYITTYQSSRK